MDYLEYALPQLTVCRLPLPRCMIRAGGFFLAFFYFFSNIKAMVCIYHNNCSKEFNTIAPLKRIKKHIFFSNFSFIFLIKFKKIECLPSYLFVEFHIIFSMQQTICLRWAALFHICPIYVANANEFKLTPILQKYSFSF